MITLKYDLLVDVSQYNYTLMLDKHKQDKKGKPVYETLGYYNTLTGAVCGAKDYCIRKILGSDVHSLTEAADEIARITDEFANLLREKMGE